MIERRDPIRNTVLLQPANLHLKAGDHVVVMGASGSGKSILMRSLAFLDTLDGGELRYRGNRIACHDIPAYRSHVAYVAQRPALFPGSVEDNLRLPFALKQHCQKRFDRRAVVALLDAVRQSAGFLEKAARDLSGGEAQILNLLRLLQFDPTILLLDEPTSALDVAATAMVEALVKRWAEQKPGVSATLWVTHDEAQSRRVGNRFFCMVDARLAERAQATGVNPSEAPEVVL
jgi:putative ABC transport system ATP-binding protein